MKNSRKLSLIAITLLSSLSVVAASAATPVPIVGGEVSASPTTATASMKDGALTIALSSVVGTDIKAVQITPTPVPDGAIICLKANGWQSADWRGGHILGGITMTPETCSWGHGVVRGGKVTMTVNACPTGRTEAAAVISGVVQLPDGKQAWIPHPAPYRILNSKRMDATGIAFNCATNKVAPLSADKAKVMAKLF